MFKILFNSENYWNMWNKTILITKFEEDQRTSLWCQVYVCSSKIIPQWYFFFRKREKEDKNCPRKSLEVSAPPRSKSATSWSGTVTTTTTATTSPSSTPETTTPFLSLAVATNLGGSKNKKRSGVPCKQYEKLGLQVSLISIFYKLISALSIDQCSNSDQHNFVAPLRLQPKKNLFVKILN